MLKSKAERSFLIGIIFLILLIPAGSFILSKRLAFNTSEDKSFDRTITKKTPSPSTDSSLNDLRKSLGIDSAKSEKSPNSDASIGLSIQFKIAIEGRPDTDEHTKLFVGIAPGGITNTPQYLLVPTIDVPASGEVSVSAAGLTPNQTYTAYIKGQAQLVKAITFTLTPNGAILNNNDPIPLLSGDLNEDNVIDQSDYDIAKAVWGLTPSSPKWKAIADLNLDNIINNLDLSIIQGNLGKVGDSGKWYSKSSGPASSSASLTPSSNNIGGSGQGKGLWIWVPDFTN